MTFSLTDFGWLTLIKAIAPQGPPKIRWNPGMREPKKEKIQIQKEPKGALQQ